MNRKRLIKICKLTQNGVANFVKKEVKCMSRKGFVYHKGKLPILLVCHMDTVHKELPKKIRGKNVISSPQGIGGDDRCGVYAVLEILKKYDCHAVFTEDEERGGIGAEYFAHSKLAKRLKDKMLFAIEIDRKGSTDAVFYRCDNKDFTEFITKDYWKEAHGSYTDICTICPSINCAGVNLSSGYYAQHTVAETINLKELDVIIEQTKKLIESGLKDNKRYEYVEKKYTRYNYGYNWDWDDYYSDYGHNYNKTKTKTNTKKIDDIVDKAEELHEKQKSSISKFLKEYYIYDMYYDAFYPIEALDEYSAVDEFEEQYSLVFDPENYIILERKEVEVDYDTTSNKYCV